MQCPPITFVGVPYFIPNHYNFQIFRVDQNGTPRQSGLANQGRALLRKFGLGHEDTLC